jgi:rhodanese-related sulfurtransferase
MSEPENIFIDIRSDSEVFNKHIDATKLASLNYSVYVIPMNMIRFNINTIINHLQWVKKIYLVCDTGRRSQYIKNKYFSNYPNIIVDNKLQFTHFNEVNNNITLSDNKTTFTIPVITQHGLYSITRIIQIIYGVIFISCASYLLFVLSKSKCNITHIPVYITLAVALMALFNGLTNTCSVSMLLRDYLN